MKSEKSRLPVTVIVQMNLKESENCYKGDFLGIPDKVSGKPNADISNGINE